MDELLVDEETPAIGLLATNESFKRNIDKVADVKGTTDDILWLSFDGPYQVIYL